MTIPFHKLRAFRVLKWVSDGDSSTWTPEIERDPMKNIEEVEGLDEADVVASELYMSEDMKNAGYVAKHMVMFDVDVPMVVLPSSTPGHHHVYFPESIVGKDVFFRLLNELALCGIVEPGYAGASKARGFAALRLPWVRKHA